MVAPWLSPSTGGLLARGALGLSGQLADRRERRDNNSRPTDPGLHSRPADARARYRLCRTRAYRVIPRILPFLSWARLSAPCVPGDSEGCEWHCLSSGTAGCDRRVCLRVERSPRVLLASCQETMVGIWMGRNARPGLPTLQDPAFRRRHSCPGRSPRYRSGC